MRCLEVNQLYFVSFSKESTTIQKAVFDVQLWNELEAEISDVYHQEACRPSKKKKCSNELASKLTSYVDTNVELMAELSSIEGRYLVESMNDQIFSHREDRLDSLREDLINIDNNVQRAYNLTRKKASELLGFMISDLDREYSFDQLHSVPIAYGLKGYSLSCSVLRKMTEMVLGECFKKGLYTQVCSFDGQWSALVVRDRNNNPLTVLQLQKDVFTKVKKMPKSEILSKILNSNCVDAGSL